MSRYDRTKVRQPNEATMIPGEMFIQDGERETQSVGNGVPTIVVGEIKDLFPGGIHQREGFARIVQRAGAHLG